MTEVLSERCEFETLNLEDLKVGDTVAIQEPTIYGWGGFVGYSYVILTISKITPKKTKMCFKNSWREINQRFHIFYKVTPEIKRESKIAEMKSVIARNISDLIRNYPRRTYAMNKNLGNYINSLCESNIKMMYEVFMKPNEFMEEYITYCEKKESEEKK